ncbi:3-phosphoshikimate 1-carboxyvinyltransferase [Mesonia ostreae]|uniref:3-phosphoshikimate 1-carboxyvinyltransferase n=1 Tax=Mesonia ostreae TaxID=861110 RepID=A0ABU2KF83_9FLAO|nr:3-phosphoshikimate 1-carboxyvinyltransferase [Mesonia ostreae]MDT0293381.1 3-phosphoshikimate 1-carboxyvinyltransferase [Mesonia ostreae]
MELLLRAKSQHLKGQLVIGGSKSESNRLLILQAFENGIIIENLSNSDDTLVLQKALQSSDKTIDIHHAGTAMRFLTAYYAGQPGREVVLTGSKRMKQRPIRPLVDALRTLGANIQYLEKEGFPPLQIKGCKIEKNEVKISANISSQYISALMLLGSSLENGLKIHLEGKITSAPYLQMTLQLLEKVGVKTEFKDQSIQIFPSKIQAKTIAVESDWSSASYFYSLVALSASAEIELSVYHEQSLQGDAAMIEIYKQLGVETKFKEDSILISKKGQAISLLELDLNATPDLAQTIAVTCFGLGIACKLSGLHTLKIKETDRLLALQKELQKLGANVNVTEDSLSLEKSSFILEDVKIATYQDHRMAMAFAPLALKAPIIIEDAEVVSKSFPNFWECLKKLQIISVTNP